MNQYRQALQLEADRIGAELTPMHGGEHFREALISLTRQLLDASEADRIIDTSDLSAGAPDVQIMEWLIAAEERCAAVARTLMPPPQADQYELGLARRVRKTLAQLASEPQNREPGAGQSEKLRALEEIIAGVAHELNNPLTGVLGYAQLLLNAGLDVNVKGKLEHIVQEASRCRQIVQNLLCFASHYEPEMSPQSANALLQEVLSLREYQLRIDSIQLVVELAPDVPPLMIDPHEMQRVFLNIITNAQQALVTVSDRSRILKISSYVKNNALYIRFEDNGPGILKENLSRVFDPFFSTKGVGQGTGLGLSVSHGIVQAHSGRILVTSAPGHGATFTIVLPLSRG